MGVDDGERVKNSKLETLLDILSFPLMLSRSRSNSLDSEFGGLFGSSHSRSSSFDSSDLEAAQATFGMIGNAASRGWEFIGDHVESIIPDSDTLETVAQAAGAVGGALAFLANFVGGLFSD